MATQTTVSLMLHSLTVAVVTLVLVQVTLVGCGTVCSVWMPPTSSRQAVTQQHAFGTSEQVSWVLGMQWHAGVLGDHCHGIL